MVMRKGRFHLACRLCLEELQKGGRFCGCCWGSTVTLAECVLLPEIAFVAGSGSQVIHVATSNHYQHIAGRFGQCRHQLDMYRWQGCGRLRAR